MMDEKTKQETEQTEETEVKIDEDEILEDTERLAVDVPEEELSISEENEQLKQEKDDLFNKYLRLQAEYDNYRKRTQREKSADLKYKSQALVTELLPVLDNFERAIQTDADNTDVKSFFEGMEMISRQLKTVLETAGVEAIKTVGEVFDPNVHQAIIQVEDDQYESNIVVEEMQRGYKLKDRVIRPAMVKVNQ